MGLLNRLLRRELDDDERAVVALVSGGITRQRELLDKSGMNPVKLNKVLRSLEEKKVAKREPRGRENVVRLL